MTEPDLAAIRAWHHRRDILGEQDRCRCGQKMPCDVLKALTVVDAQAERLARAESDAAAMRRDLLTARRSMSRNGIGTNGVFDSLGSEAGVQILADLAAAREQADNGHKLLAAAEKLAERFLAERNQARAEAAEQRGRLRVWSQLTAYLHHGPHCDSISTLPGDCNCGLRGRMQAALASAGASLVSAAPERPDLKAYHAFAAQYDDSSLTIGRVAGMLEEVITYALALEAQPDAAREALRQHADDQCECSPDHGAPSCVACYDRAALGEAEHG